MACAVSAEEALVRAVWPYAGQSKSGRVWTNFKKKGKPSRCLGPDWIAASADPSVTKPLGREQK